jgi:flavin-binding protein dodecin
VHAQRGHPTIAPLKFRDHVAASLAHSLPTAASAPRCNRPELAESVYKIIELVGTSTESWEKAAAAAVNQASKSLRDLRIAEIVQLDMHMQNGKIAAYRAKVKVSFKFERGKG